MQFKYHLLATSALLAAALSSTAYAQTTGSKAATASSNTIEELVVTAQKREQSLQDVPVAVSAFTSEKRDLIGINTIADMTNFTPGLEYNAQNDRNTLRGIGRNTNVHAADGSVAQYSDGVYTSSTVEAGKTPLFVDRVEVLRGPQGTLYGRNSIGGAINIISKRPTDDFYAEVRAQYQNYNQSILEGAVSGPTMIPGVEFRFGANWDRQTDGWFKNTVPGQADGGNIIDTKYVEGQLKFKFNDRFDAWMKLAWADWHNGSGGPGSRDTWVPAPFATYQAANPIEVPNSGYACLAGTGVTNIITAGGQSLAQACHNGALDSPRSFSSDIPFQVKLTGTMIFASEWNYHFDNMDLKYIAGGTHYDYALSGPATNPYDQAPITSFTLPRVLPAGTLGAGSPTVTIPGAGPVQDLRYAFNYHEALNWVSHEVNLASTNKGPFQWIVGAFYYDEDYTQPVYTTLNDVGGQLAPQLANTCSTAGSGNPSALNGPACPELADNGHVYDDRPSLNTKSKAAFGQIDWQFTPHWKTTIGLRYTQDEKKGQETLRLVCFSVAGCGVAPELLGSNFTLDFTELPSVVGGFPGFPGGAGTPGVSTNTTLDPATGFATRYYSDHWSATTGTFGVQWDPEPGTMAYFNYSRGYKAGGFRIGIDTTIGTAPATEPEHMNAFEVGLKKDFGRTLQVNMAAFYYDYENDQIPLTIPSTAGGLAQAQSVFFNVPKAKSQGFELESIWQPIDHLQILFNYSYLDAHVTKGDGVVDPADPAALANGAKPDLSFAQCASSGSCPADLFTAPGAFIQNAAGALVPYTGAGGFQRGQSIVGNQLPNAPKNKVAINANYTYEMDSGSLIGSVSYIWRDKQFGSLFDRDYYEAPSYDQWDARLTWKAQSNHFTIIAFIKNIGNTLGYEGGSTASRVAGFIPSYVTGDTSATALAPIPVTTQGTSVAGIAPVHIKEDGIAVGYLLTPPRTYGIELQYRF
jgi:iron complex outermembrane receptor protein